MKIEHVALWAKDIDKIKSFYEKYFSAKSNSLYTNPKTRFSSYFLSFGSGARLEIMQMQSVSDKTRNPNPHDQSTGYIHIAISVGSEEKVNTLTAKLLKDGFKVLDGPRKTGDGYYESVVLDPEQNRVEITV